MELQRDTIVDELTEQLSKTKDSLSETAHRFSKSVEEYMALPLLERMEMARGMVENYAVQRGDNCTSQANWPATAVFASEDIDTVFEARAAYISERGTSALNDYFVNTYQGIGLWLRARDDNKGVRTQFTDYGKIEWGGYQVNDGSKYGQWITGIHANLQTKTEYRFRTDTKQVALDSPEAEQLIAMVDATVGTLIEGVIAKHRRLGTIAVDHTD